MNRDEQVVAGFWNLFNKKIWLDELKMKDSFKRYKPSELHCIEYIEKNADANVTKLAESFYVTRSAISKITKKLMEKGLVESYQKPDNNHRACHRRSNLCSPRPCRTRFYGYGPYRGGNPGFA